MYQGFIFELETSFQPIPENKNPKTFRGNPNDRILRYLDRAVLQYTFGILEEFAFDTVRAPFQEGYELYTGSGFREYDHIHLCVRNPASIESLFDSTIL